MTQDIKTTNKIVAKIYRKILLNTKPALDYLINERGINDATIAENFLGYANNQNIVTNYLKSKAMPFEYFASPDGGDYFKNRIMIPFIENGEIISFTSRAFPTHDPVHKHMKGSMKLIYNRDALVESKYIFIVESPMCCLTLKQNNFNAIATCGTKHKLMLNTDKTIKIYIVPDIDKNMAGGINAIKLSAKLFLDGFEKTNIVYLSYDYNSKTDVNSFFLNHTRDDFIDVCKKAIHCSNQKDIIISKNGHDTITSWKNEIEKIQKTKEFTKQEKMGYDIEDVRNISLIKVVSDYVGKVTQKGDLYACRCPFHEDSVPSFFIYSKRGSETWYCFGHGEGGDIIAFIQKIEGISYGQAIDFLKSRYL